MTGFGRASGAMSDRFFASITVKSVNHRFLEVGIRLPEYLWEVEAPVRTLAAATFSRGKIEISVKVQKSVQAEYSVRVNQQIAGVVIPQLRQIADELQLGHAFTASDLLRVPDLLQVEPVDLEVTDEERDALLRIVGEAFEQMKGMRKTEGKSLQHDIASRLETIRRMQLEVASHREEVRAELLASYQQRVQEIAAAAGVDVAADRIAQEVVVMVEKGDIAEELTRLAHHVEQMDRAIGGREAAGKKLDFLSQEMVREINTMGSKSRSAALRTVVVELKTEVERIREQVQNVE